MYRKLLHIGFGSERRKDRSYFEQMVFFLLLFYSDRLEELSMCSNFFKSTTIEDEK